MQLIETDGAQHGRQKHLGEKGHSYPVKFPLIYNTCLRSLVWKTPWPDQHTLKEISRTCFQMKGRLYVFLHEESQKKFNTAYYAVLNLGIMN